MKNYPTIFVFVLGSTIGMSIPLLLFYCHQPSEIAHNHFRRLSAHSSITKLKFPGKIELHNNSVADDLFHKVRIVCWVLTYSRNHQSKAVHVKNTWAKRCNKLIFMSDIVDIELGSIASPVINGRDFLWEKTKYAFLYIFQHHLNDGDWFLKADDDK